MSKRSSGEMPSLYCQICRVSVPSDAAVMMTHVLDRPHQNLKAYQDRQRSLASRSIYVRGFMSALTSHDYLLEVFKDYGEVKKITFDSQKGPYAFIEFKNVADAQKLLSNSNLVKQKHKMLIKPKEVKLYPTMNANDDPNPKSEFDETEDSKSDNEIYEKLKSCKSILEQIHRLVSELELKPDEIQERYFLLQELESLLRSVTKEDCKLHLFGSSANGFGVKGSDVDIAFYMKDSSVADCDNSQLPAVDSSTQHDRIKLIAHTLEESGKGRYSSVYPVAQARCPLVKFVHSPTNIKCDLSIKNDMGLLARQNTELIKFFVNYQPFFRPVGFAIRYWAKLNDIAGNLNGGPRLSNYALIMLLLFYLHKINLVPSVEQLAQIADEDRTIDGWHCSFGTNIGRYLPRSDNPSSLASVLCGFFDFYHNFDFMSNVICMRTSTAVDTIAFYQSLTRNLEHFKISSMCVQDPFVLDHNLTLNVTETMKCKIVESFANAVAICQRPEFDRFSDIESEAGLLLLLRSTNAENHDNSDCSTVSYCRYAVMMTHVMGRPLQNLKAYQDRQRSLASRSIYVRGFMSALTSHDYLLEVFKDYGEVKKITFDSQKGPYAFVEFKNVADAQKLLSNSNLVKQKHKMLIKPREVKLYPTMNANDDPNPKSEFDETEDSKSDNEIYEKLKSCKSIPEQIHRLVSELELKPDEIRKRNFLLQELESLLQSVTKEDCILHLFGSSANGFGVKGSDLDIAFYMKDSSVEDCDNSQLPVDDSTTQHDRIKLIARILEEYGKRRYSSINPVARARCPLVKFVHSPTNIKCDLSIRNDMGLLARQNTKLIKFFVNYQPFVRPLGFAIRYWAKLNDIAGNPNGGPRLSNYALTMLLLFYLHKINLVPSVEQLAQIADEDRTIDGWHCSFGTNIGLLPRPDNPSSLTSVLCGFFDFYHNFDFMSNVICMKTSTAFDTIAFSQLLRRKLKKHFRISSMYVLDPFVLVHNLTFNVTEKMKCKIVESFANAVAICQRPEFDVFSDSESEAGLLLLLRSTNAENHNSI